MSVAKRAAPFRTYNHPVLVDAHPNILTDAEREHAVERLSSGAAPRSWIVRKLIRMCDLREDKIRRAMAALNAMAWSPTENREEWAASTEGQLYKRVSDALEALRG